MATLTCIATGARNWTRGIQASLATDNSHRRVTLSGGEDEDSEVSHTVPMLPWLTGDGGVNTTLLKSLTRRVLGVVMQNPEEHLVDQLYVLNPQFWTGLLSAICPKELHVCCLSNRLTCEKGELDVADTIKFMSLFLRTARQFLQLLEYDGQVKVCKFL